MIKNFIGAFVTPRKTFREILKAPLQFQTWVLAVGGFVLVILGVSGLVAVVLALASGIPGGGGPDGITVMRHASAFALPILLIPFVIAQIACSLGRLFGGVASFKEVFAVVIWATVPVLLPAVILSLVGLPYVIPLVALWQLALFIVFLSEAHKITIARSAVYSLASVAITLPLIYFLRILLWSS